MSNLAMMMAKGRSGRPSDVSQYPSAEAYQRAIEEWEKGGGGKGGGKGGGGGKLDPVALRNKELEQRLVSMGPAGYTGAIRRNLGLNQNIIGYGADPDNFVSGAFGENYSNPFGGEMAGPTPGNTGFSNIGAPAPKPAQRPVPETVKPPTNRFADLTNQQLNRRINRTDARVDPLQNPQLRRFENRNPEPAKDDFNRLRAYLEAALMWQRQREAAYNRGTPGTANMLGGM